MIYKGTQLARVKLKQPTWYNSCEGCFFLGKGSCCQKDHYQEYGCVDKTAYYIWVKLEEAQTTSKMPIDND